MSKCSAIFSLGLASVLLVACQSASVPKDARLLTPAEIQHKATDVTSWGHTPAGNTFVSYAAADGTTETRSGNFTDEGVWHVAPGGKFCIKWHKIRNGAETCLTQYSDAKNIYSVLPDGSVVSVVTRQAPGNPEHL